MRWSRRTRLWMAAIAAFAGMALWLVALPQLVIVTPVIGAAIGYAAFSILSSAVRAARRERKRKRFE